MLNSFYAKMLVALQERIITEVPEIRYIDQDLGQIDDYEERPAVAFPCVLVDFTGTSFDQLSQLVEMGDATIQFRLAFATYSASNSLTPDAVKEKALNFYEIENKIYKALKGWTDADEMFQPLNRVSDGSEKRTDMRVRRLLFSTMYEDYSAMADRTEQEVNLSLEL